MEFGLQIRPAQFDAGSRLQIQHSVGYHRLEHVEKPGLPGLFAPARISARQRGAGRRRFVGIEVLAGRVFRALTDIKRSAARSAKNGA